MVEITIEIEGMHCSMCEAHVNDVIRRVEGVKKVNSSCRKGKALVIGEDSLNSEEVIKAITSQGYVVSNVERKEYVKKGFFRREKC